MSFIINRVAIGVKSLHSRYVEHFQTIYFRQIIEFGIPRMIIVIGDHENTKKNKKIKNYAISNKNYSEIILSRLRDRKICAHLSESGDKNRFGFF